MTVCKWAQNLLENSYSAGEEDGLRERVSPLPDSFVFRNEK